MEQMEYLFNIHSLYNLARYSFLAIESNYARIVESSGITLPQLRVLWVIKVFPATSLTNIAKIGCWTSPTVSNMIKILLSKKLIFKEETVNRKAYMFQLTQRGNHFIDINKQVEEKGFYIFHLIDLFTHKELDFIIDIFTKVAICEKKEYIFDYIEKINGLNLKINLTGIDKNKSIIIKKIISIDILLRTFVLTVENSHREPLKEFDITYAQLRALWIIKAFPGITSKELSEIGFWSPSTVHVIVKNLCNKKFIYREKSLIKNAYYLDISMQGEDLIIEDYDKNQKTLLIFQELKDIKFKDILIINNLLAKINNKLGNHKTKEYIQKTFEIIKNNRIISFKSRC